MGARSWAIGIGGFDCVVAVFIAAALLLSGADPATKSLDIIAGWSVVLLLLVTAVPALALAWTSRAPKTALAFALAFPVCFILLSVVVIVAYVL